MTRLILGMGLVVALALASGCTSHEQMTLVTPDLSSRPFRLTIQRTMTAAPGDLFEAWRQWCKEQGRDKPGTAQTFGRDLGSPFPAIKVTRPRDGHGGRLRQYEGIDLHYATPA